GSGEGLVGVVRSFLRGVDPVYDDDQTLPVLDCRADQPVTRFLREPGFQSIGSAHCTEEWVAVLLTDLVPGVIGFAENLIEIRIGADDMARQRAKLACRHLFSRVESHAR